MTSSSKHHVKIYQANKAFTPSAPIDDYDLFAGRQKIIQNVIGGIGQKGQHVVIYGERGVGKTSLANVLRFFLAQFIGGDSCVVKVNCDGNSTASSIWRSALREIPVVAEGGGVGYTAQTAKRLVELENQIPENVSPEDIRYVLQQLKTSPVIIFDELDRIKSKKTITALTDTIKTLSDHAVSTTLILVGVADSVDHLIAEHRSIERALVQVKMPRMSQDELKEIVRKALAKIKMTITGDALDKISRISQGLPHYTHLLGLHAAQAAILADTSDVTNMHVWSAINESVEHAQQSIRSAYHDAVSSPRGNLYPQVLLACALAQVDELGYFTSVQVRDPMSRVMQKKYEIAAYSRHLTDFCSTSRGPILQKAGFRRRFRYRFINPLMQPYVVMKGFADNTINEELWDLG